MTHRYYEVAAPIDYQDKDGNTQTRWINCGVAFPDRDGDGFTLSLSAMPVGTLNRQRKSMEYKLRMQPPRERDNRGNQRPAQQQGGFDDDIPF